MKYILFLFTFCYFSGYAQSSKQTFLNSADYCRLLNMALEDSVSQGIFRVNKDHQFLLLGQFCACIENLDTHRIHGFSFFLSKDSITDTRYYEVGYQTIDANSIRISIRHYQDDAILILHIIRRNRKWICEKRNYGNY